MEEPLAIAALDMTKSAAKAAGNMISGQAADAIANAAGHLVYEKSTEKFDDELQQRIHRWHHGAASRKRKAGKSLAALWPHCGTPHPALITPRLYPHWRLATRDRDTVVYTRRSLISERYHRNSVDAPKKCRPDDMALFDLDYGDLIRPPFEILPNRGWGQCTNATGEYLIVYGPKHRDEQSMFDTSPYVLPPLCTTPDGWDCDGFYVPSDRALHRLRGRTKGPAAVKFWNFRRFTVDRADADTYRSFWPNGVFQPSQINWAIPNLPYAEILARIRARGESARR